MSVRVSGTVTDSNGNPIEGAHVSVTDTTDNINEFVGETNATGEWNTTLEDGTYEVRVHKAGYEDNTKTFEVSGSPVHIEQTLAPDYYTVSGYVNDTDGNRIEGATVVFSNESGTVGSVTTLSDGSYSMNVLNGTYTLNASKDGKPNGSASVTVDGAPVTGANITLGENLLAGKVTNLAGQPVADATVKILAVNYSALDVQDPSELNSRADELLDQASNVTPPGWKRTKNLNLKQTLKDSGTYVAVHTKSDWELQGHTVSEIDRVLTRDAVSLSTPETRLAPGETAVFSIWDATAEQRLEDSADEDLPGQTTSGTVVIQQIGPSGEELQDPRRLDTTGTIKLRTVFQPLGKTHETATATLSAGFYRVYPESNPGASYVIAVGNPGSIIEGWASNLRDRAGDLTEKAKQIQDRVDSHKFEPISTTTDANGRWAVTVDDNLEKATVIAYKVPDLPSKEDLQNATNVSDVVDLPDVPAAEDIRNRDIENVSRQDMRDVFEASNYSVENGLPDKPGYSMEDAVQKAKKGVGTAKNALTGSFGVPRTEMQVTVPAQNVNLTIEKRDAPSFGDSEQTENRTERSTAATTGASYAGSVPVISSPMPTVPTPNITKLRDRLANLTLENSRLRQRLNETMLNNTNTTNVSAMRHQIDELQEALAEQRNTISNGTVDESVSNDTVSLSIPWTADLAAENVVVLAHRSDGTTDALSPQNSSYVSVEQNPVGDDMVHINDYPINGTPITNFEILVATEEGVGSTETTVRNPAFTGSIPGLSAIDVSSLHPGPNEPVEVRVQPDSGADFKRVTDVTVYGPGGEEVNTTVRDGRTASFTPAGAGTHTVQVTYSNLDGTEFAATFQLVAGVRDKAMPAGIRVVESPTGTFALAGDGLAGGDVEVGNGGESVEVFARLPNDTHAPSDGLHVYTHALDLPPDAAVTVYLVRGKDRRAVEQTVSVTMHLASVPDDAHVYWGDGQPLPMDGETRWGTVDQQSGQTVIETYTNDATGAVRVETNADPGWYAEAVWLWRSTIAGLPFSTSALPAFPTLPLDAVPSLPGIGHGNAVGGVLGVAGVAAARRREVV